MSDAAEADRLQVENRKLMLELQQLRLERELGELRRGGEREWPQPWQWTALAMVVLVGGVANLVTATLAVLASLR